MHAHACAAAAAAGRIGAPAGACKQTAHITKSKVALRLLAFSTRARLYCMRHGRRCSGGAGQLGAGGSRVHYNSARRAPHGIPRAHIKTGVAVAGPHRQPRGPGGHCGDHLQGGRPQLSHAPPHCAARRCSSRPPPARGPAGAQGTPTCWADAQLVQTTKNRAPRLRAPTRMLPGRGLARAGRCRCPNAPVQLVGCQLAAGRPRGAAAGQVTRQAPPCSTPARWQPCPAMGARERWKQRLECSQGRCSGLVKRQARLARCKPTVHLCDELRIAFPVQAGVGCEGSRHAAREQPPGRFPPAALRRCSRPLPTCMHL